MKCEHCDLELIENSPYTICIEGTFTHVDNPEMVIKRFPFCQFSCMFMWCLDDLIGNPSTALLDHSWLKVIKQLHDYVLGIQVRVTK